MIVYNVRRQFFTMKNDAEAYRKCLGLPPGATFKVEVKGREDLAEVLNAITATQKTALTGPPVVSSDAEACVPPEVQGLEKVWDRFKSIK